MSVQNNEKLIEEAAKAMWAANGPEDWDRATGTEQAEHLTLASAALAVFEKARTPTDDEREERAEAIVSRHLSRLAKQSPRWAEDDTAIGGQAANIVRQLAEAGLLRRSEVPEPNTGCHWCDGAGCRHCIDTEPQGEPSDAQVAAAGRELFDRARPGNEHADMTYLEVRGEYEADARAALRAAGGVR